MSGVANYQCNCCPSNATHTGTIHERDMSRLSTGAGGTSPPCSQTADANKDICTVRSGMVGGVIQSLIPPRKDRALHRDVNLRPLTSLVWSMGLYGCESWTLTAEDRKRIECFEMTAYRRLLRVSSTKHRTNASMSISTVPEEFQPPTCQQDKKQKLQCFGQYSTHQKSKVKLGYIIVHSKA